MHASIYRVTAVGVVALTLAMTPNAQSQRSRATTQSLGGADRFLTAISTDKPLYHPGDTVYVRGVVLHAFKHTPAPNGYAQVALTGPKGERLAGTNSNIVEGAWAFVWQVPEEAAGGEYKVRVDYPWQGDPPAERKFDVRAFRPPRLKSQIVFLRDGFGPGDEVTATLEVTRAEGGIPAGAKVTATARVDEQEVARVPATVDAKGRCTVSFRLPKEMAKGDGALAFAIEDGGVVETAAKTIPILLQTVDLAMYPEGGELVAGVATRIYFEAKTPAKKPADLAGEVVDQASGKVVGEFRSEHEGRGRFELTPSEGARYALRITEPAGIRKAFPLPDVQPDGAVVRALADVFGPNDKVKLFVAGRGGAPYKVTLSQREVEVASGTTSGSRSTVALDPGHADGVLVATVWDRRGAPLAERLVFRRPAHALKVELKAERESYIPGATVKLSAKTTQNGKPVSAVVGLTVLDDSVLQIIERREQPPSLPVMALLEPEVKELADAQIYFDDKNPKAPVATDLLLGTQGWRRFALVDAAKLVREEGDLGRRALAYKVPPPPPAPRPMHAFGGMRRNVPMAARPLAAEMDEEPAAMAPEMDEELEAMPPEPAMRAPMRPMPAPKPGRAQMPMAMPVQAVPRQRVAAEAMRDDFMDEDLRVAGKRRMRAAPNVAYVRQYAHEVRKDRQPADRVDFAETLFWTAGIRTDAKTGEASVSFGLSDAVTSFRATAGAYTNEGALGAGEAMIRSVQPFYLEPKLPLEVTQGDVVRAPVALVNGTSGTIGQARVEVAAGKPLTAGALSAVSLKAGDRVRRLLELRVGNGNGKTTIALDARAGDYLDRVERALEVKPRGFPTEIARGGLVSAAKPAVQEVIIPAKIVPDSLTATIAVYPTPVANMTEALTRLIREPSGCFEQTSSTTYPLTMAQQYFISHQGVDPQLVSQAREKLERGYRRLVGFECKEKGYEWFGQDPGHEALSAYGLMHFADMAKVREVDGAMLERTRAWLLKQRDGKGGFERKRRALHTWIEDKDTSNAYILWALLEAGQKGLEAEIAAVKNAAMESANSYVVALGANVAALAGDRRTAQRLMSKLASKQSKDGVVEGGTQSIVGSGGQALAIETTSLAALAWLRNPEYAPNVDRSIRYLADNCKSGRYGSTQSTVLALKAIVAYDTARARAKAAGKVRVLVDGKVVGDWVKFNPSDQGAIGLPDIAGRLSGGKHTIRLEMAGGNEMPYAMTVNFNATTPASSPDCKVGLQVALAKPAVAEGELVEAVATVKNRTGELLPTVVAIVGVPGGLEPRHDQLKELVKQGTIDAYEVRGRDVVLYWRGMEPEKKIRVALSLVAAVPGTYTGPASRAYLYYTDELKTWVDGLGADIAPKG